MGLFSEYAQIIDDAKNFLEEERLTSPFTISLPSKKNSKNLELSSCTACDGYKGINPHVPGVGSQNPDILILGDLPGKTESSRSKCFDIAEGKLFTAMLSAMKLSRDQVYISNIFKCYTTDIENYKCKKWLDIQVDKLRPKVILALGEITIKKLMSTEDDIKSTRGKWFKYQNIPTIGTYHPKELIENKSLKRAAWEDLQKVMREIS